jgi:DUF4097 and DUF4098 domain-containing protein YvlB
MISALMTAALAVTLQQTDTTFAVRPNGHLDLENYNGGRVQIRSWERNELRIRARHGRGVQIEINREGSQVSVEPESRRGLPGSVDFDISVPRSFNISFDAITSEVDIADINGDIEAETVNGNILIAGITGRIAASSIEGTVTVRDSRGVVAAETVNRTVEIVNHQGDVDASTVNGSVILRGIRSNDVNAETVNGSVQYDGDFRDGGSYDLSTHNGTIVVSIPEGTGATVTVETFQGEIESDFPISLRNSRRQDRTTFNIGEGGARLHLSSFGGNIRLRRPVSR